MRAMIVAVVLGAVCSCAPVGDARPCRRVAAAPSGAACTLYDKSTVGWTMKRAVFASALVGGTPGDRQQFEASGHSGGYDAFWTCTTYARAEKSAWCECPRGSSRLFEDAMEKDSPVVWVAGAR
jgi:hypothetical protein